MYKAANLDSVGTGGIFNLMILVIRGVDRVS